MLTVELRVAHGAQDFLLRAGVWNVSGLARVSDYDYAFDGREKLTGASLLSGYPRWSEPVFGPVVRCLALTQPAQGRAALLPSDWTRADLEIGIVPGGRGPYRAISVAQIVRGRDGQAVLWATEDALRGHFHMTLKSAYADAWALADDAMRYALEGSDELSDPVAPLPVIRRDGKSFYVGLEDIPEWAAGEFARRVWHAERPFVEGHPDAVYVDDWISFLDGVR